MPDPAGSSDPRSAANQPTLPMAAGLCGKCLYASTNSTRRGTTYLRCTRAKWDDRLVKYPRLPVLDCVGYVAE